MQLVSLKEVRPRTAALHTRQRPRLRNTQKMSILSNAATALLHEWMDNLDSGIYANVTTLGYTPEDIAAAIAFSEAFSGAVSDDGRDGDNGAFKVFWLAQATLCHVAKFVKNYGDTGFGDKPPALNRVSYWAQHLGTAVLDAVVCEINSAPIDRMVVFESDKSLSASPKCKFCKTKIGRGSVALRLASVKFLCNPLIDLKPRLKCTTHTIACPDCVDSHGYTRGFNWPYKAYGPPVQRGITHAHQAAADELCALVNAKRHGAAV